ncbi:ubiquitin-specific protease doa4 [Coemansia interrupta]|uniref:ubiquitinyl hydrolase 1 n=1 Tax=Coemansia interrupta TaxID=1126814 RepID=A0A9W8HRP5_9FUNG|nr:ubiquitin-specific protease doa4 [Coemansia interrupta]
MSRIRDGATSDLIRRFENLALSKGGETAELARTEVDERTQAPPLLTKRTPVTINHIAAVPSRLSSFPELEGTPPLAPTHQPISNPTHAPKSDQLLATGGFSVSPLAPNSLPPPTRQRTNSQLEELASIITTSYGKKTEAPRRKSLVTSLNQRAAIKPTISMPAKKWLSTAERYMDEGRLAKETGDSETAYLKYMIASNIMREKLPSLRDYDQVSRSSTLKQLKQQFATRVLDDLEVLADELRQKPYVEMASPGSLEGVVESLGAEEQENSSSRWLAEEKSRVEEIDAQARMIDVQARLLDQSAAPLSGTSVISRGASKRATLTLSPYLSSIAETADTSGEFVPAGTTTCTPAELLALLDRAGISGRPTVLLLDVRPHQEYVWGRIEHKYTVNVDPLGLKKGCSSADIESSLVLAPDEQLDWFRRRDQFDLVVYVTQSAHSFNDTQNSEITSANYLNKAIYNDDYVKALQHSPLFLMGGFDEWAKYMNNRRCVWSDEARRTLARSPRPKSMMVTWDGTDGRGSEGLDISSMLAYHAPTSGISGSALAPYHVRYQAAPPVPAVPAVPVMPEASQSSDPADGASTTPVSGSVFDFFQQNGHYRPQWPQQQQQQQQTPLTEQQPAGVEDRHRPTHTSFTRGYSGIASPPMESAPKAEPVAQASETNVAAVEEDFEGNLPAPGRSELARRKTIFDNPTYGFTGPAYGNTAHGEVSADASADAITAEQKPSVLRRRRQPPPIPSMKLPPKPAEYSVPETQQQQHYEASPAVEQMPSKPQLYAPTQQPQAPQQQYYPPQQQQQQQQQYVQPAAPYQYQQYSHVQQGYANGYNMYSHPVAAGSDPSLNGRMHAGANLRSSITYAPPPPPQQQPMQYHQQYHSPAPPQQQPSQPMPKKSRKPSALDSAAYGATGLKNFGNTCFMNSVIQCLVGTAPFARYFLQGGWKKDLVRSSQNTAQLEVASEFARLVDNMWRGQYGSISPIGFRSAVGSCSLQFKGNDQEDAHEFASFLLDTLHESLNRVHPRPPPPRDMTPEEEQMFERQSSIAQADEMWRRYTARNWSIMTSIFQGQVQSRLTCLSCNGTSTTYHTFTELSVPIPSDNAANGGSSKPGLFLRRSAGRSAAPVSLYQCLSAFSEIETLDGENKWHCPRCKTKRRATKRLLVSHLPLVLIVHLKRFSTIGHFREKLETNVIFPTQQLEMDPYVISDLRGQHTGYKLYAVANHYGSLSAGHYTASVFNGLRGQWNYFDDTRVTPIAEEKVATPAAYLLFFVQVQPPTQ